MILLCVVRRVIQMMCFYLASLMTYCVMCYSSLWVTMLLLFSSHCDEVMYKSEQQQWLLSTRVMLLSGCQKSKSKRKLFLNYIFVQGFFFPILCEYNMYIVRKRRVQM